MQRIIIIAVAILISLPVIMKSRRSGPESAPTAFSVVSSAVRLIMISGDVSCPGIYSIGANALTVSAIKMAMPDRAFKGLNPPASGLRPVKSGEHLHLVVRKDGTGTISVGSMASIERIIMGLPLDINLMDADDFDLLPGVGPVVAQRIIEYRQNNGGKMRVEELQAVEGIGEKRYKSLLMYF